MSRPATPSVPADTVTGFAAEAGEVQTALALVWGNAMAQVAQFQADWFRGAADAAAKVRASGSLADLVTIPQAWAMARAGAYADAGLRLACAGILPTEAAAHPGAFRLPD